MHIVPGYVDAGPVAQVPADARGYADVVVASDAHLAVAVAEFEVVVCVVDCSVHDELEFT